MSYGSRGVAAWGQGTTPAHPARGLSPSAVPSTVCGAWECMELYQHLPLHHPHTHGTALTSAQDVSPLRQCLGACET